MVHDIARYLGTIVSIGLLAVAVAVGWWIAG